MKLLFSNNARIFCLANSSGNGSFSNDFFSMTHGFISLLSISMPFTRIASPWAISLWHNRCFAVGQGNRLIREHSSDNCGFSPSHRVSMSRS